LALAAGSTRGTQEDGTHEASSFRQAASPLRDLILLDLFVKKQRRFIFRGSIGDYHEPQMWGLDALHVGDGPGIGGLLVWQGDRWVPLYGAGAVESQRVVASGPLRGIIEVTLKAGNAEVRRTYTLAEHKEIIFEELRPVGGQGGVFAAALAPLEMQGDLDRIAGIWSFGTSVEAAGPIGLAGALLSSRSSEIVTVHGGPALRFECESGEAIYLAWVAGGTSYGDDTDIEWATRASNLLAGAREGWIACR
jgi:hypothetical protein